MKFTKLLFVGVLASLALSACDESEEFTSQNEMVTDIIVTGEDIVPELGVATRTSYTMESNLKFSWSTGDTLGIYPIGGTQVDFPISTGEGSKSAAFDGGAWALRSTYTYAAYYPFTAKNFHIKENSIPVDYSGQEQNGNGSLAHLGEYDFMAAAATSPSAAGGVNLAMKHLGSFVRLQLTMPVADTYKSVTLSCDGEKFTTTATYDLTAATPVLTPKSKSSSYTIKLRNTSTTEKNELLTVYAFVGPADLSGNQLTVTVSGTANQTYVGTVDGKNMQARGGYNYALEFKRGTNASGDDIIFDDHEYVDLGVVVGGESVYWATTNIGAERPADFGLYFAWGETSGYTEVTSGWANYKFMQEGMSGWQYITKYTIADGQKSGIWYDGDTFVGDGKKVLDPEDDAAHVNWQGAWRMPTKEEQDALRTQCTWTWTTMTNSTGVSVKGYKVSSKTDSSKYIFLPIRSNTGLPNGFYWSSSLYNDSQFAYNLIFDSESPMWSGNTRDLALPVRPVCQ